MKRQAPFACGKATRLFGRRIFAQANTLSCCEPSICSQSERSFSRHNFTRAVCQPSFTGTRRTRVTPSSSAFHTKQEREGGSRTNATPSSVLPRILPRGKEGINITFTAEEEKIFKLLLEVCQENSLSTKIRVAGGWVRDKVRSLIRGFNHINTSIRFGSLPTRNQSSYLIWISLSTIWLEVNFVNIFPIISTNWDISPLPMVVLHSLSLYYYSNSQKTRSDSTESSSIETS